MSRIIPAIDIIEGKCVRLTKGDYATKKVYDDNPVDVAKSFADAGIEYLHVVDLDGAKAKNPVNLQVLEKIKSATPMKVDFGGGIKSKEAATAVFNAGADQITLGSLAVKEPELVKQWITEYGSKSIIIGADTVDGKIATDGWLETYEYDIIGFINDYISAGAQYFLCTDINKDGMLQGPNTDLYKQILAECEGVKLIASGGVSGIQDVLDLQKIEVDGIIIGKAIYEGNIHIDDLSTI